MLTKTYQLEELICPSCTIKIESALKKEKGVKEVQVLFNASKVKVTFDEGSKDSSNIRKTIERLGYEVIGEK